MYPDQNQNQQQYSIDYLNQIAPKPPKKGMAPNMKWIVFGLGGAIIVTIILVIVAGLTDGVDKTQTLAARLQTTTSIAELARPNIKSSQLRSLNSSLIILLANTNRDIAKPLAAQGVKTSKLDENIIAAESGEKILSNLEEARLNAVYDRTYAREMAYQLERTLLLMQEMFEGTKNQAMKQLLEDSYNSLAPLQKQFADFSSAES